MSSKKHTRYKLLLDEGLPRREKFPQLNNLHELKPSQKLGHVVTITNEMIVVTPRKAGENK